MYPIISKKGENVKKPKKGTAAHFIKIPQWVVEDADPYNARRKMNAKNKSRLTRKSACFLIVS